MIDGSELSGARPADRKRDRAPGGQPAPRRRERSELAVREAKLLNKLDDSPGAL